MPAGIPSEALQRRTDLAAAAARLWASRAALFPKISLTPSAGTQVAEPEDLLDAGFGGVWTLAGNLAQPTKKLKFALPKQVVHVYLYLSGDLRSNMSENQPSNADILRELRQINNELRQLKSDVGQLKEGQTALQIGVGKIVTWQKALTAGLGAAGLIATSIIGLILFLHSE